MESGATLRAWKRLVLACRRWSVLLLSLLGRDRRDEEICASSSSAVCSVDVDDQDARLMVSDRR